MRTQEQAQQGCYRKSGYASLESARVAASHKSGTSYAYRCGLCGDWHLTSQRPSKGKIVRSRRRRKSKQDHSLRQSLGDSLRSLTSDTK